MEKNNRLVILSSAQCNYKDVQTHDLEEKGKKRKGTVLTIRAAGLLDRNVLWCRLVSAF